MFDKSDFSFYPFEPVVDIPDMAFYHVYLEKSLWSTEASISYFTGLGLAITHWLKCNTSGVVMHEFTNGGRLIGANNKTDNPHNRFLFENREEANAFKETLPDLISNHCHAGFDFLIDKVNNIEGVFMLNPNILRARTTKYCEYWLWCAENLKGRVWQMAGNLLFEIRDDMTLFVLKFS